MNLETMQQLSEEVGQGLEKVREWRVDSTPSIPDGSILYVGRSATWNYAIFSFSLEEQGFPSGSRGFDGTATGVEHPTIVRLTREQATRGAKLACQAIAKE